MTRFFETLIFGHNLYFVTAALVICVLGTIAIVNVYRRASLEEGQSRFFWTLGCAVTAGATVWVTHFLVMLGHNGHETMGLDFQIAVYSLLISIFGVGFGFSLAQ